MDSILNKFTGTAKNCILASFQIAEKYNYSKVNLYHLLYGLIKQKGSLGAELLLKNSASEKLITQKFSKTNKRKINTPPLDEEVKNVIVRAVLIAHTYKHRYISTEHILSAIIDIHPEIIEKTLDPK